MSKKPCKKHALTSKRSKIVKVRESFVLAEVAPIKIMQRIGCCVALLVATGMLHHTANAETMQLASLNYEQDARPAVSLSNRLKHLNSDQIFRPANYESSAEEGAMYQLIENSQGLWLVMVPATPQTTRQAARWMGDPKTYPLYFD